MPSCPVVQFDMEAFLVNVPEAATPKSQSYVQYEALMSVAMHTTEDNNVQP